MTDKRKDCPMRHENGNCTVAGGFCTAVNDPICEALHNAFECGYRSAIREQEHFREVTKKVEPLTLDDLREMEGQPVWMHTFSAVQKKTNVAQWAILETVGSANATFLRAGVNSRLTKWFCNYGERWLAYRQKPEEGTE